MIAGPATSSMCLGLEAVDGCGGVEDEEVEGPGVSLTKGVEGPGIATGGARGATTGRCGGVEDEGVEGPGCGGVGPGTAGKKSSNVASPNALKGLMCLSNSERDGGFWPFLQRKCNVQYYK